MNGLPLRQVVMYTLLLAAALEGVTVFCRFGLGWESAVVGASIVAPLTFGIRVHHGYFGIAGIVLAAQWWCRRPAAARWLLIAGIALALSDAVHHLLVLWPIVGSPQFDLVFPRE